MPDGGVKKWFMLQVWRIQQVSQIITLALVAIQNALLVYGYISWRGAVFENPYIMLPMVMVAIALSIWIAAVVWDMRLKMWREQATVLVERNPYSKEKMSTKEIMIYGILWLPVMERLGQDDPKVKAAGEALKDWMKKSIEHKAVSIKDIEDVFKYIGADGSELLDFMKKK